MPWATDNSDDEVKAVGDVVRFPQRSASRQDVPAAQPIDDLSDEEFRSIMGFAWRRNDMEEGEAPTSAD